MKSQSCYRFLPLMALAASMTACAKPPESTPVEAYLAFMRAVAEGKSAASFDALTSLSREALTTQANAVPPHVRTDAAMYLLSRAEKPAPPQEVKLLREEPGQAILQISTVQGRGTAILRKEDNAWKIDLTHFLTRSAAALPHPR